MAPISAPVPDSAATSQRTCGNAPARVAFEGRPKCSSFSFVSGTSVVEPSIDTTRSPQQNTPAASGGADRAGDLRRTACAADRPPTGSGPGTARRCSAATDALGPAPQPGQVEQYAAYRAAWRALGRPEIDREETELSDGQLRMRVRAWEREKPWAPRYVGNELAGTRQAAAHQRQTAALRQRRSRRPPTATPPSAPGCSGRPPRPRPWPRTLDERAAELQQLDDARAPGSPTPPAPGPTPSAPRPMLAERHADDAEPEPVVTAEEWLAAHRAADAAEDRATARSPRPTSPRRRRRDRPDVERRTTIEAPTGMRRPRSPSADRHRPPRDRRRRAGARRRGRRARATAAESADAVAQADRALAEIRAREAEDDRRGRAATAPSELARWHDEDQAAATPTLDDRRRRRRRRRRRPRPESRAGRRRRGGAARIGAADGRTGSGGGPSCRHAHRSVARIASHHPGRCSTRSGRRASSCSAARYSASISSS